ncbi:C-5 sterol desaturase [Catellatospora methionotrophica]|uniref:C-5 sterol desaturase n=1 Tax=Catellatospora methionotrophica TaxID=121620 RepID=A0A8J3LRV9_9ACTN|nr:sterol desaturase family protein [Catellatospora methionotrophica]GIG17775.1 C-5 sterol desaturase [Catellatospora methionotrophica]
MELPPFPNVVLYSVPLFILLMVLERVSYWFHPDADEVGYGGKDTATSLSMGLGSLGWDVLWGIGTAAATSAIYLLTPLRIDFHWWALPLFLIAQDLCYYWSHRGHHMIRLLWASHVVHHSSQTFNLSTALRQSWTGFTGFLFYLPLAAVGVNPAVTAFCGGINLVYQFWIHTERIDKMWRPYEFVFNTPSHHRVHHASQGGYLDRNFGGILIIWDRLFGSFAPELERPVYGLTKNITTHNPLRVAYHEYAAILRDLRTRRVRAWLPTLLRGPGWSPTPAPAPAPAATAKPVAVAVAAAD